MAYVLFALRVPAGADLEEAAEALAVRLATGIERGDPALSSVRDDVATVIRAAEPAMTPTTADVVGASALTDGAGVRVDVHEQFVRLRVGYLADADIASAVMDRVFGVLAAVLRTRDAWSVYDPQGVHAVTLDDAGRAATLELYQSVVDQVAPTPFGGSARDTGNS